MLLPRTVAEEKTKEALGLSTDEIQHSMAGSEDEKAVEDKGAC